MTWRIALSHLGALALSSQASAQSFDPVDAATRAVNRACDARAGQAIPRERLAAALRLEASLGLPEDDEANAIAAVANPELIKERAADRAIRLAAAKALLLQDLAISGSALQKALKVSPPPPPNGISTVDWLFGPTATYTLTCAAAKAAPPAQFADLPFVVARKSAAELAKVGDERKAAGSAQIAFDSLRTTNLAGDVKKTRKLVINAALGVSLAGNEDRYGLIYGEYSRSRVRIRTAPNPTDPSKNGSADDVDALELGLLGSTRLGDAVRLNSRAGVIFDRVTGARYLAGTLSWFPITGGLPDLGLCNLGSFRSLGAGIEAMCLASVEADLRHVLRRGDAVITEKDAIAAIGPAVGISFRRSLGLNGKPQDGLVGSVNYRYLPVVTGRAPDLDRLEASLAYRWWSDEVGFDLGLTYTDGIERKSLADEHRFGFTFGIIF